MLYLTKGVPFIKAAPTVPLHFGKGRHLDPLPFWFTVYTDFEWLLLLEICYFLNTQSHLSHFLYTYYVLQPRRLDLNYTMEVTLKKSGRYSSRRAVIVLFIVNKYSLQIAYYFSPGTNIGESTSFVKTHT